MTELMIVAEVAIVVVDTVVREVVAMGGVGNVVWLYVVFIRRLHIWHHNVMMTVVVCMVKSIPTTLSVNNLYSVVDMFICGSCRGVVGLKVVLFVLMVLGPMIVIKSVVVSLVMNVVVVFLDMFVVIVDIIVNIVDVLVQICVVVVMSSQMNDVVVDMLV